MHNANVIQIFTLLVKVFVFGLGHPEGLYDSSHSFNYIKIVNANGVSNAKRFSNANEVSNDKGYDLSNNKGYDVSNDKGYDVSNDDGYDVLKGKGLDVLNGYGYTVSKANEFDVSNDEEYDTSNRKGYDVSKINEYYHVSKSNIYEDNEIIYLEESKETNETELRVPCVNNTTNQSVCLCSLDGTFTDCSRQNLTFFPIVPLETKTLNMSGNSLKNLDQDSLTNISTLSKSLKSKNQISYIENGSLSNFTVLKILNVSVNHISNIAIENLTSGISTQLEHLILEGLQLKELPYHSMPHLNNTRLSTFSVKNNSIKNVSTTEIFQSLKKLKHLDLSLNSIRQINVGHSETLETLSLSRNELTRIPHFCRDGVTLPKIYWIFLDNNCIRKLHTDRLDCLDSLQLLNISATGIQSIPTNAFSEFKSLRIITLEKTESLNSIEPYAFNSSTLHKVYIRFNRLVFNRRQVDVSTILRLCPSLQRLDISGNYLTTMKNTDWNDLFGHVGRLMWLDISNSEILFLPSAIPKYLLKLQDLHVSNTAIHFIPNGYFSKLTELRVLFLNGNKLTTIKAQDFPPSFTSHLYIINVAFNPFVCDCDLLWFIEFADANRYKMNLYPKNYECSKGKWKQINHFNINKKACMLKNETSEIIQCTCIATIFLMLIMSVVYRYRWRLRYMFFVLNFRRCKCANNRKMEFTHDVYVSSADANFNTVYYQIIMELENKGINVFFPSRDATVGSMALSESLENMDSCKCVIICLSNAYAQDCWCEFEACMAVERSIYEHCNSNAIIVVVLEEICSLNVTKIIHKLTRTGDYLIWDENSATNGLFWRKLGQMVELPVP